MKIIYVVYGETGSYSDFSKWAVKGFASKKRADEYAEQAQKRAREIEAFTKTKTWLDMRNATEEEKKKYKNEYDPDFYSDGGTDYSVEEMEYDAARSSLSDS